MNYADQSQVIEALRELGHVEQDIESAINGLEAGDYDLSMIADYIEAMEAGDDDEAFMCACALGLA